LWRHLPPEIRQMKKRQNGAAKVGPFENGFFHVTVFKWGEDILLLRCLLFENSIEFSNFCISHIISFKKNFFLSLRRAIQQNFYKKKFLKNCANARKALF
jgi:hypothetical protein